MSRIRTNTTFIIITIIIRRNPNHLQKCIFQEWTTIKLANHSTRLGLSGRFVRVASRHDGHSFHICSVQRAPQRARLERDQFERGTHNSSTNVFAWLLCQRAASSLLSHFAANSLGLHGQLLLDEHHRFWPSSKLSQWRTSFASGERQTPSTQVCGARVAHSHADRTRVFNRWLDCEGKQRKGSV